LHSLGGEYKFWIAKLTLAIQGIEGKNKIKKMIKNIILNSEKKFKMFQFWTYCPRSIESEILKYGILNITHWKWKEK
jgi:hypothetical protein